MAKVALDDRASAAAAGVAVSPDSPSLPDSDDVGSDETRPEGLPEKYRASPKQSSLLSSAAFTNNKRKDRDQVLAEVRENGYALKHVDPFFRDDPEVVREALKTSWGQAFEYAGPNCKKDPAFVLPLLKSWSGGVPVARHADPSLWKQKTFVLAAVRLDGYYLEYADASFRDDPAIVREAVKTYGGPLEFAGPNCRKDPAIVLAAVKRCGSALQYADETLRANREIVLAAVQANGLALQFASAPPRKSREIVLAAVKADPWALQYAEDFRKDKEIVLAAVKKSSEAFQWADPSLTRDKDFVLKVVQTNGLALSYADASLQADRDVVLAAIRADGFAFRYAGSSLRTDKSFVLQAVKQNPWSFRYADASLKEDKDFVIRVMSVSGFAIQYVGPYRNDKDVVLVASEQNGFALGYADRSLLQEREFVLSVVRKNGAALLHTPTKFRRDREVVLAAVRQDGLALQYAMAPLLDVKEDGSVVEASPDQVRQTILAAVQQNGKALKYAAELGDDFIKDREIVRAAVQQDGLALEYAHPSLAVDKDTVLLAVRQNGEALEWADETLRSDYEIVLAAVSQNGRAIEWAHEWYRKEEDDIILAAAKTYKGALDGVNVEVRKDLEPEAASSSMAFLQSARGNAVAWAHFVHRYREDLQATGLLPYTKHYDDFRAAVQSLFNIEFFERFASPDILFDVLKNRLGQSDGRPAAIALYTKSDYNGAFADFPVIERLRELGYRVLYYENATEGELVSSLEQATKHGTRKASVILIGGHGSPSVLKLGEGVGEKFELDVSDFVDDAPDVDLSKYIAPNGDVILYSCSTGAGGGYNPENLANSVARTLPGGVSVQSPKDDTNIRSLRLSEDKRHIEVEWKEVQPYRVQGAAQEEPRSQPPV